MLAVIQDRIEQKDWLRRNGFPVGEYRAVRSLDELREAVAALGRQVFLQERDGRIRRTRAGQGWVYDRALSLKMRFAAHGRRWATGRRRGEGGRAGARDLGAGGAGSERRGEGLSAGVESP